MAGSRPAIFRRSPESREALRAARLEGESEGRLFGRNEERRRISQWLKFQKGTPEELARRIDLGEHMRD